MHTLCAGNKLSMPRQPLCQVQYWWTQKPTVPVNVLHCRPQETYKEARYGRVWEATVNKQAGLPGTCVYRKSCMQVGPCCLPHDAAAQAATQSQPNKQRVLNLVCLTFATVLLTNALIPKSAILASPWRFIRMLAGWRGHKEGEPVGA